MTGGPFRVAVPRVVATLVLLFGTALPASAAAAGMPSRTWWHPGRLTSWAYLLGEKYPLRVPPAMGPVQVYDSDLGDQDGLGRSGAPLPDRTIERSVAAVHKTGAHAICYVDAGSAENWRSDYGQLAPSLLGRPMPGWPGERYIDVTQWTSPRGPGGETLQQVMTERIHLCRQEGFDAVEADNVDAYSAGNIGGFSLTMNDDETYVARLAVVSHRDGLAFFLKNGIDGDSFIAALAPKVDGEIVEQCWQYHECRALRIFVRLGKPVLDVEYARFTERALCPKALAFPMATIETDLDLDGRTSYGCWRYRPPANGSGAR